MMEKEMKRKSISTNSNTNGLYTNTMYESTTFKKYEIEFGVVNMHKRHKSPKGPITKNNCFGSAQMMASR